MNKETLLELLSLLRQQGIICYTYRETAYHILSSGKVDSTLHLITDASANVVSNALKAGDFKNVTVNGENVDARWGKQSVRIKIISGGQEKLIKTITQPLTINSLLLRADGQVYDLYSALEDIHNRILRRTEAPIQDKGAFCTMCFEMTLKKGFTADKSVVSEMKKMVTLPLPQKVQLLQTVKNLIKSANYSISNLLNAFAYDGLFTNVGEISRDRRQQLDSVFRKAEPDSLMMLLCFMAGFWTDNIKPVVGLNFSKDMWIIF